MSTSPVSIKNLMVASDHPRLHLDESTLSTLIERVCRNEGYEITYLGLILTDHETVRQLNIDYLGRDYLTDVLAFNLASSDPDEQIIDGEVYIDLDTARERAPEFGVSFQHEAQRYVVHGLLHLMGYVDDTPSQKAVMRALEDRYLAKIDKTT